MHDTRLLESPDKGLGRDWFELAINAPAAVSGAELVQVDPRPFRKLRTLLEKRLEATGARRRKGNHVCPTCQRGLEPLTALDGGFVPMEALGRDGLYYGRSREPEGLRVVLDRVWTDPPTGV